MQTLLVNTTVQWVLTDAPSNTTTDHNTAIGYKTLLVQSIVKPLVLI